jgi:hypothetical protein
MNFEQPTTDDGSEKIEKENNTSEKEESKIIGEKPNIFSEKGLKNYQDFKEKFYNQDEKQHTEGEIKQIFLYRNLNIILPSQDFSGSEKSKKEKRDGSDYSDIVFFLKGGEIKVSILGGDNPEVVIRVDPKYDLKDLKECFEVLSEYAGILISPIVLFNEKEIYPFPDAPNDSPIGLPPGAIKITEEEWSKVKSPSYTRDSSSHFWDYPCIGAKGLRTSYGIINGMLLFCDGVTAIFDTPQGKIKLPFDEILDPFGERYGERKRKKDKENRKKQVANNPKEENKQLYL